MHSLDFAYFDIRGSEKAPMENDGKTLKVKLRGVTFEGEDFDSLSPRDPDLDDLLTQFDLHQGCLCQCRLIVRFPTTVVFQNKVSIVDLEATLELGKPSTTGRLDRQSVYLRLLHEDTNIASSGNSGWFEDEMLEIQRNLPEGSYMRNCMNCAYSDYSPIGHGLFGDMLCFRNLKQEYMAIEGKNDFWEIHDQFDRFVQETHVCEEFTRRATGTGYRG